MIVKLSIRHPFPPHAPGPSIVLKIPAFLTWDPSDPAATPFQATDGGEKVSGPGPWSNTTYQHLMALFFNQIQ